jgi:uncharacterized phage protein (TIGR01671 family)
MREIKFRAWDKFNQYITHDISIISLLLLMLFKNKPIKNHTLMQYTGLKDKNSKEIYESDLVIGIFGTGMQGFKSTHNQKRKCEIKFSPESGYYLKTIDGDFKYRFYPLISECEIIGNIYENPELLKKL